MKRLTNVLLAATIVAFAASCQKEIEQVVVPEGNGFTVLTAKTDNDLKTKTSLNGVNVVWTAQDIITAFDSEGTRFTSDAPVLQNEAGTIVKFTVHTESPEYAVYPVVSQNMVNGQIPAKIPISQNAKSGSFDNGANVAIAKVTDPNDIHFKNVGGLLAVKIKATTHTIKSIKISAEGTNMTGDILSSIDAEGNVTTSFSTAEDADVADYVEITANPSFEVEATYYAVVAPGTYNNVTVVFTDGDGKTATYTKNTPLVVERNSNQLIGGFSPDSRWVSAPFFYESFDLTSGTGGNDGSWSGAIASSTLTPDNEGWVFVSEGGASQCAKFGTGSSKGSALTPALNITSNLATLTFKAGAWNKDKTDLFLSVDGNGVISENKVTMLNNEWSNFTVYIAGADENTKVKFYTDVVSRFFLDEIKVVEGGNAFDYLIVPQEVNVAHEATTASFTIETGSAWTITGADDVEIDFTSGEGNSTVTLSFSENETASDVTIAVLTVTAGEKTATVTIKQSGNPNAIEALTIHEFLNKEVGDAYYRLTGTITNLYDTSYGNFTLVDDSGSVLVYGLTKTKVTSNDKSFSSIGVEEGDIVTIEGKRAEHNSTPQVGGPAYHISHIKTPSLSVNPSTLVFPVEGGSETISATARNFTGDVTVSASCDNPQFTTSVSGTVITVTATENAGSETLTGTITINATDGTNTKTATVGVTQNKPVQSAQDGDILWQEDFTGYGTAMPATATGSHVFGEGTVSYATVNGGATTALYNSGDAFAGGSLPELLVSKSNGSFIISGIPTGSSASMTLTYKTNNDYFVISASNGITLRNDATYVNKLKTVYLTVPEGVSSFDLEFKNTNSGNCRVDNFMLVAGAPKVKESQTITFGDNKSVEWIIGTDCVLNTAKQGLTVTGAHTTVTYSSSDSEVATVDNDGKVTPIKAGVVTITANAVETNSFTSATDEYSLTIIDPSASKIEYSLTIQTSDFNSTSYTANNNEKTSTAVATDDSGKSISVKWTSNQVMLSSNVMQWQKSNGCIYNSTKLGTIKSVTITSSAGTFTTYYGDQEQPDSSTTVGGGFFKIKVGSTTGKSSKVVIVFEK